MTELGRWLLAQAAGVVGVVCVALHLLTALGPQHSDLWTRALLLAMAGGCLPCIGRLWRGPTRRTWVMTGGMYAGMISAHLLLLRPWASSSGMAHHMGARLTWTDLAMWGGLALALVQLTLVAVAMLTHLARVPRHGAVTSRPVA